MRALTNAKARSTARMLNLPRLRRIRLTPKPLTQRMVGGLVLPLNYHVWPGKVRIEVEGAENLPPGPVIFAMNHPDRYNYFPFQYWLRNQTQRYTATWVKGKYYENAGVGAFMEFTNQLPTVSRGYIVARDVKSTLGRKPTSEEYAALRALADADARGEAGDRLTDEQLRQIPGMLLRKRRDILGRLFEPSRETYAAAINATYREMMKLFVGLHDQTFAAGLDLLIFPQGTRSVRLSRGRIGLAQVALHYKLPVVPIGCNGSEKLYPSASPWAKSGRVVYRIGAPILYGSLPDTTIDEPYAPFTMAAEKAHRETFQRYVDGVMDAINELLDPEYRYARDQESEGVTGTERFL